MSEEKFSEQDLKLAFISYKAVIGHLEEKKKILINTSTELSVEAFIR